MMLKLNTLLLVKTILLSVSMLFSVGLFAQSEKTTEKSTIVMTKSELSSFLSTVADARRAQLKEREEKQSKNYLEELRLKYQQRSRTEFNGGENVSNQQILNELRYLNQRIDNLQSKNNIFPSTGRDNSTIIMPSNGTAVSPYAQNGRSATTIVTSNNKKINELQSKIDSLKRVEANKKVLVKDNSYGDTLKSLKRNLSDVRNQMEMLESKMMDKSKKTVKSGESKEKKSYFKQQVYFDNNSENLRDEYLKYVQDLTQILIDYPEAKVLLEGWASPLGKAEYNKQLSMRRAESVKKAFINNRIKPSRIISAFRGEDKSSSAQHARRVDMSITVE